MSSAMSFATASEIARLDAHDQAALVRSGQVAPDALIEAAIVRIEKLDAPLNAISFRAFDHARASASRYSTIAPMAAVPYLLKASLEYPGFPVASGSRARQGDIATAAFPLVQALDAAGMIAVGMSTMPEFGLNATGEALLYGPTRNPWDLSRSAGGSSSGSAAAVAAGLVPFSTASDAAGSIRIPASNCGILGFKPSRGWNIRARAWNLIDDILCSDGLYGRSVRDMIWAARHLRPAGKLSVPTPPQLRIALDLTGLDDQQPAPEVATVIRRTARVCEDLGHTVEEVSQPIDRPAMRVGFTTLWDYLGGEIVDHYGDMAAQVLEPWTLGLGKRREAITPEALAEALAQVDRATRCLTQFHGAYDLVLSPVTATAPPPIGYLAPTQDHDELWEALNGYVNYTPLHNLTGLPSISVPLFTGEIALPIGSMFSAAHGRDEVLLGLAAQLETACPWVGRWPHAAGMA